LKIFRSHDTDKSNSISTEELDAVLKGCKYNFDKIPSSSAWLISMIDNDGTKTLSEGEFIHFIGILDRNRKLYQAADAKKTNALSNAEVQEILNKQKYQFTDAQLKVLTPLVDNDSSGSMSCEEFLLLSVFLRFCKIHFILADADGGGDISSSELLAVLPALGLAPTKETVDVFMKKLGADGKLTFEQFTLLAAMVKLQ